MKLNFALLILLLLILNACGGGGGNSGINDVEVAGRWQGTVELSPESCIPPADQYLDLSGKTYILDISPLDAEQRLVVRDQDGAKYEQFFPEGVVQGEFSVLSLDQDFTTATPTGPTSLGFDANDGQTARGEVLVTYNRFCTVYFEGQFTKITTLN